MERRGEKRVIRINNNNKQHEELFRPQAQPDTITQACCTVHRYTIHCRLKEIHIAG